MDRGSREVKPNLVELNKNRIVITSGSALYRYGRRMCGDLYIRVKCQFRAVKVEGRKAIYFQLNMIGRHDMAEKVNCWHDG